MRQFKFISLVFLFCIVGLGCSAKKAEQATEAGSEQVQDPNDPRPSRDAYVGETRRYYDGKIINYKIKQQADYSTGADEELTELLTEYGPQLKEVLEALEGEAVFQGINPSISASKRKLESILDLSSYENADLKSSVEGKKKRASELVDILEELSEDDGIAYAGRKQIQSIYRKADKELDRIVSEYHLED